MTFPRGSGKTHRIDINFEILNESLADFVALHMLVYHKSFKATMRWVSINLPRMMRNMYWITPEQFAEVESEVSSKILTFEARSRNRYKQEYRRLLQQLEVK